MAVAATLVGLGVLLLIGYNWEAMPAPLKVVAILVALIGTHAAGFHLGFRLGWLRASEVVFFLGCLFYGAAIFLLAQIFHIESSNYDGLWWWAVGVLPFAYFLDTVLLHLLFAALLALWIGFDVLSLERLFWRTIPSAGYSLPFLVAPGLWWAYRRNSATTVGVYIPLLAWWAILQPIAWKMPANPTFFIGAVGSLMLMIAALHPPRSLLAVPYRFYGIALAGSTLVLLSFYEFNKEIVQNGNNLLFGGVEQMSLILVLTVAGLIVAYARSKALPTAIALTRDSVVDSLRAIAGQRWLPIGLLCLFALLAAFGTRDTGPWIPTIGANLGMVAVALWLIRLGLTEDQSRPFGAGVIYLMLWAVLRYIDLFGALGGMLGAALMFFFCGGALFVIALYWRKRKAVSLA